MILVNDLKRWLDMLTPGDCVYVDDGGLTLKSELDPDAYLEVGGDWEPEYGDDDDGDDD